MNATVIFEFVKKILPMNKIGAFILGVIGAGLALVVGVSNSDLKKSYCEADVVALPKAEVVAPAAPAPAPVVEKK